MTSKGRSASGSTISCSCWVTLLRLRYNPYTQTVEVLNNSDKILDMAKELKGDLAIVASALRKVQERDGELDPSVVSTFLTAGLDISPYGSRYSSNSCDLSFLNQVYHSNWLPS